MKTKNITIRQISIVAMLAALCAVFGYVAIDLTFVKITFESFPVILGSLLLGPVYGMLIGGIGTLIYQLLRYGVSSTTVLWMLPYILSGMLTGFYAQKKNFVFTKKQLYLIALTNEIAIMILNTAVIYIDSKIYGYYSAAYVFGAIIPRFIIALIKAVAFGSVLPLIINRVRFVITEQT